MMSSSICIPRASKNATLLECSRRSPCAPSFTPPSSSTSTDLKNGQDSQVAETLVAVLKCRVTLYLALTVPRPLAELQHARSPSAFEPHPRLPAEPDRQSLCPQLPSSSALLLPSHHGGTEQVDKHVAGASNDDVIIPGLNVSGEARPSIPLP